MAFDCIPRTFNLLSNSLFLISNLERRYIPRASKQKFSVQNLLPYKTSIGWIAIINKAIFEILKNLFDTEKIVIHEIPDISWANKICTIPVFSKILCINCRLKENKGFHFNVYKYFS